MWQDLKVSWSVSPPSRTCFMTWLQLVMFWIHETGKNLFPAAWDGFFRWMGGGGNRKKKKKGKRCASPLIEWSDFPPASFRNSSLLLLGKKRWEVLPELWEEPQCGRAGAHVTAPKAAKSLARFLPLELHGHWRHFFSFIAFFPLTVFFF